MEAGGAQLRRVPAGASVTSAGKIVRWSTRRPSPLQLCLSASRFFRHCKIHAQRGEGHRGFHTESQPGGCSGWELSTGLIPTPTRFLSNAGGLLILPISQTQTRFLFKKCFPQKEHIQKQVPHIPVDEVFKEYHVCNLTK